MLFMSSQVCWINKHSDGPDLFVLVLDVTYVQNIRPQMEINCVYFIKFHINVTFYVLALHDYMKHRISFNMRTFLDIYPDTKS